VNPQATRTPLILDHIIHPSDFSPASEVAFAHALKLALIARAELCMMGSVPVMGTSRFSRS